MYIGDKKRYSSKTTDSEPSPPPPNTSRGPIVPLAYKGVYSSLTFLWGQYPTRYTITLLVTKRYSDPMPTVSIVRQIYFGSHLAQHVHAAYLRRYVAYLKYQIAKTYIVSSTTTEPDRLLGAIFETLRAY